MLLCLGGIGTLASLPRKGDRSNPSNYRLTGLISCLSKALETIRNSKLLKHVSSFNLLSDHQYGFLKGRFTGDFLAILTASLSRFGQNRYN